MPSLKKAVPSLFDLSISTGLMAILDVEFNATEASIERSMYDNFISRYFISKKIIINATIF